MSQKAKMRINIDISGFTGIYKGVLTYKKQYKSADGMPRQYLPLANGGVCDDRFSEKRGAL